MCVQSFDDSQGFAIRITYRNSLRSSSVWEPRHPLLKGVDDYRGHPGRRATHSDYILGEHNDFGTFVTWINQELVGPCLHLVVAIRHITVAMTISQGSKEEWALGSDTFSTRQGASRCQWQKFDCDL
jgi:hypothetical protein